MDILAAAKVTQPTGASIRSGVKKVRPSSEPRRCARTDRDFCLKNDLLLVGRCCAGVVDERCRRKARMVVILRYQEDLDPVGDRKGA